jgi:hypothetical protein
MRAGLVRSDEKASVRPRCAAGDAAVMAGCSSTATVHTIESLKIGALQHHCHGHRSLTGEELLKA